MSFSLPEATRIGQVKQFSKYRVSVYFLIEAGFIIHPTPRFKFDGRGVGGGEEEIKVQPERTH